MYFCEKCNVLFRRDDLVVDKKAVEDMLKQKNAEKFEQDKDKLKINDELLKEKSLSEKKQVILRDLKETKKYYISRKSNVLHVSNCPYAKNIKRENRIILKSLDGTENLKRCRCMTD